MQTIFKRTIAAASTLLFAAMLYIPATHAQNTTTLRGLTYESLKDLPDWSGAWGSNGGGGRGGQSLGADPPGPPENPRLLRELPPMRDTELLAKYKASLTNAGGDNIARQAAQGARPALKDLGGGICGMYGAGSGGFNGRTANGPEVTLEFLFTPGRVTLLTDHSMVRRIYTDGRPIPDEDARSITLTGTSIGHWEGDTLVVTTVGLSPHTVITGGVPAGKGFRVDERMYLDEKHTMHIDGTVTAPEVYTEPHHYTQVYNRFLDRKYELAEYLSECEHVDRSINKEKAEQQFDLTPPSDIAPPPSN